MVKKHYVLDTNVLLQDPQAIFKFEENHVYIPIIVLEEVDKFKNESSERGRNARHVSKILDQQRDMGSLRDGLDLESGGKLFVYVPKERGQLNLALQPNSADSDIISCALEIQKSNIGEPTCLITRDVNLRIRADILGICAENYENQSVNLDSVDSGYIEMEVGLEEINEIYKEGILYDIDSNYYSNQCAIFKNTLNNGSALVRYNGRKKGWVLVKVPKDGVLGIKPRNKEQNFALDLLLDDNIKLVNLVGKSGSGKTLLATAVGLKKVLKDGIYSKLVVARPIMPFGKDIGFLPGSLEEKLNPWMKPIMDNVEFLSMNKEIKSLLPKNSKGMVNLDKIFEDGMIQIEPLTYIRGRSLPNQFIILDEAQNVNLHEIRTILSRCGEGTKIVLTGDPDQIDSPYIDSSSNGLSIAYERFKGENIVGGIRMMKCERSELADLAVEKLK